MKSTVMTTRVAPYATRPARPLAELLKLMRRWVEVSRQRSVLAAMTEDQLRDIGITRADADAEAARPFWDSRV